MSVHLAMRLAAAHLGHRNVVHVALGRRAATARARDLIEGVRAEGGVRAQSSPRTSPRLVSTSAAARRTSQAAIAPPLRGVHAPTPPRSRRQQATNAPQRMAALFTQFSTLNIHGRANSEHTCNNQRSMSTRSKTRLLCIDALMGRAGNHERGSTDQHSLTNGVGRGYEQ